MVTLTQESRRECLLDSTVWKKHRKPRKEHRARTPRTSPLSRLPRPGNPRVRERDGGRAHTPIQTQIAHNHWPVTSTQSSRISPSELHISLIVCHN